MSTDLTIGQAQSKTATLRQNGSVLSLRPDAGQNTSGDSVLKSFSGSVNGSQIIDVPDEAAGFRLYPTTNAIRFAVNEAPATVGAMATPKAITGATKASPCVVTAVAHGFSNGDIVIISGVVGMTQLNRQRYKIANKATDTFELTDPDTGANIDSTAFSTYTSGGVAQKVVTPAVGGIAKNDAWEIRSLVPGTKRTLEILTPSATTVDGEFF